MPDKPIIAGPEMEYDVRVLRPLGLIDGQTVDVWPDSSGNGNDIAGAGDPHFVLDGWSPGVDAVRLQDVVGNDDERFLPHRKNQDL